MSFFVVFSYIKLRNLGPVSSGNYGYGFLFCNVLYFQPSFAKEVGIPEEKTALLISVEAPSTLVAVLLLVKIVDYFSSHRLQFYQMGFLLFAVSQTFTAEARTFASFVALMVAYGLASGVAVPLKSVLAEQILGKDRASEGVGFLFEILGFAYISDPPLVGEFFFPDGIYA